MHFFDPGRSKDVHRYFRKEEPTLEQFFFRKWPKTRFALSATAFLFVSFLRLTVSWVTLGMLILSSGSTLLFFYFSLSTDLPLGLISIGVIFPVTLGISFTFGRRETLLKDVAAMKSACFSMFLAARDLSKPTDELKPLLRELRSAVATTLIVVRQTLLHLTPTGAHTEIYHGLDWIQQILVKINRIEKPEGQIGEGKQRCTNISFTFYSKKEHQ